jgi:hypothetical protein
MLVNRHSLANKVRLNPLRFCVRNKSVVDVGSSMSYAQLAISRGNDRRRKVAIHTTRDYTQNLIHNTTSNTA